MKLGLALSLSNRSVWGTGVVNGEAALTGQAVTVSKGSMGANLLQTFTDNFATLDTNKWTSSNTNGTISIVSGALDLTTGGAAGDHATITSVNKYDLRESEVYVRVVRPYLGTVSVDGGRLIMRVFDSATGKHGDYVEWFIESNLDLAWRTVDNGGIIDAGGLGDWAEASHAWLKISLSGTTATWWTAPDSGSGTPGTWTSRHTYAALPSTFSSVQVALWVENWGTGQGAITQSGRLDGLNVAVS